METNKTSEKQTKMTHFHFDPREPSIRAERAIRLRGTGIYGVVVNHNAKTHASVFFRPREGGTETT